jgi:hypothetical protein
MATRDWQVAMWLKTTLNMFGDGPVGAMTTMRKEQPESRNHHGRPTVSHGCTAEADYQLKILQSDGD